MKLNASSVLAATLFLLFSIQSYSQTNPHKYIMDSLNPYGSYEAKKARYQAIKDLGAEAVTIDMWWGIVEPEEGQFHWEIYKENFKIAQEVGLKVIPIFSFHPVDEGDAKFPLGEWIWKKTKKFKDQYGVENSEYPEFFSQVGHELRKKVMESFRDNFYEFESIIPKIYIGFGPQGEGRYPSFSWKDWRFPGVGRHQAGSESAIKSFQDHMEREMGTIEKLNSVWHSNFTSFDQIMTPTDGLHFFSDGAETPYGKDFLDWYQGVLEKSMDLDQKNANDVFKNTSRPYRAALAGKLAGIYWLATDPVFKNGAARAAGYYILERIIKVFAKNFFELTFTCFEMANRDEYPDFSKAADLVRYVTQIANALNVKVSGENAEPFRLKQRSIESIKAAYRNILAVFRTSIISAFTFLRIDDLVDENGKFKPEADLYKEFVSLSAEAHPVAPPREEHFTEMGPPQISECIDTLVKANPAVGHPGHQSVQLGGLQP